MCVNTGVVAFDQVLEVIVVVRRVAIRVHGDKAGVLQKSWIHPSARARERVWNRVDHVVFEPLKTAFRGEIVDLSRRLARVNWAAHHGHRERR